MERKINRQINMNEIDLNMTFSSDDAKAFFGSSKYAVIPGFCDVHVHFREPGFSYKETIRTGSMAAARGGYTEHCCKVALLYNARRILAILSQHVID